MNAYFSVLKLRLQLGLQYRAAALAGIATQFFFGFIHIMVFEAFYAHASGTPPMSLEQLASYTWLKQAFLALIVLWFRDNEIFGLITSGNVAYELCRPVSLYGFWYAKLLAQRISGALLRCFPILLAVFFLPAPYRMQAPPSLASLALFIAVLAIGLLVIGALSMLMYISVFYTLSPAGSMLMFVIISDFFAGIILPLPLMPDWLRQIAELLPFHLTADFPFRVYTGHIPPEEAVWGIFKQLAWLAALIVLGAAWLRKALRRVVIQGG